MHYTIERTLKTEPFGDILDSNRRAANEPGRAQAFALARQLGKRNPDSTIFVNEVISRDEENIIAAYNANEEVRTKYPDIEYLDTKVHNRLRKIFQETLKREMKSGQTELEAKGWLLEMLAGVKVETES